MSSTSSAQPSPVASETWKNVTRSWLSVVCSVVTLTPELARSACRHLPEYSIESAELFWELVHQDYTAKYTRHNNIKTVSDLRRLWGKMRPGVAKFDQMFAELWPDEPADRLDTLPSQQHHRMLKQALLVFQAWTGDEFKYMGVWHLLVRHAKWDMLRPLVADATGDVGASQQQQSAEKKRQSKLLRKEMLEDDAAEEKEDRPRELADEKAMGGERVVKKPVGCVTPTERDGKARQNTEMARGRPNRKQRLAGNKAVAVMEAMHHAELVQGVELGKTGNLKPPQQVCVEQDGDPLPTVEVENASDGPQEGHQKVEDVQSTLAWIGVSCSFADATPTLEETYEWFWFLVSSYYYDALATENCHYGIEDTRAVENYHFDIEDALKHRWQELRSRVAAFHKIYETVLVGREAPTRMKREDMIAQALEAYWEKFGHWFQHRAEWEILERHVDWEAVLKPLLFRQHGNKNAQRVHPVESVEEENISSNVSHRQPSDQATPKKRARLSVFVPRVDKNCELPLPSLEAHSDNAAFEKQSPMMAQWLELNNRRLEMDTMTQSDDGLSSEALEYLRLRRQHILKKARLEIQSDTRSPGADP